eukprot:c17898_g1_i1.p1 GENE.c17898_g1_i1~~c17898_g1_i1.p1  ORF type:complete len:218 (-),score=31.51 c17898_g1_i1:32-685(-)
MLRKVCSRWTFAEDERLRNLVDKYGEGLWSQIAREMPSRVGKQCRERWRNHLAPNITREPFSLSKDELLMDMVKICGTSWARIADALPGRTENMVKNRFYSTLAKRMRHDRAKTNRQLEGKPCSRRRGCRRRRPGDWSSSDDEWRERLDQSVGAQSERTTPANHFMRTFGKATRSPKSDLAEISLSSLNTEQELLFAQTLCELQRAWVCAQPILEEQ